ncbi:hypothetical protein CPB84DRAFT_1761788 [Gymnopilus junonius]|uniref:Uncharacterized protein n=1 Tax=Gymnopilus junonius TaxID=109634 RepID=A0A9P5P2D5_GYMJU|nr:hypothetical protein CPB84DRAFT_1796008 [Gymnopilus junonius]KAF8912254.1 hypothetical protein CPB84DRAFT_1761788 [Gymnopilus junonius]
MCLQNLAQHPELSLLVQSLKLKGIGCFNFFYSIRSELLRKSFQSILQKSTRNFARYLPCFIKMQSITLDEMETQGEILLALRHHPALTKISMTTRDSEGLNRNFENASLDKVTRLAVSIPYEDAANLNALLRACTNLEELELMQEFLKIPSLCLPSSACTRLRTLKGPLGILKEIIPGRPIECLDSRRRYSKLYRRDSLFYKGKIPLKELSFARTMLNNSLGSYPTSDHKTAPPTARFKYEFWNGLAMGRYMLPRDIKEICFEIKVDHSICDLDFTQFLSLLGERYASLRRVSTCLKGPHWNLTQSGQWVKTTG